ncbi:MAG TPA: helix-turn-helix domain-containing protein, partial [Steroidobacteraceae bacterium]
MNHKKRQGTSKRSRGDATGEQSAPRRYRAPALEKGLDILELLASEAKPMSASAVVQRLGRST